jgi:phospholipase D1/2
VSARWLINGDDYFQALLPVLQRARHSIYIADWYFSPGLFLDRGATPQQHRLDRVLLQKATEGVKINILIWNAPSVGFDLQSPYVVSRMSALHANISALAHPAWTPIIWSNHQKFVVVDEHVAFVGGIDLCFCRYDNENYALTDPDERYYPGRDFSNLNFMGESNGPTRDQVIDRRRLPRMPWHDIHMMALGEVAQDIAKNFIQRWNHAMRTTTKDYRLILAPISPISAEEGAALVAGGPSLYPQLEVQALRSGSFWSCGIIEPERSIYQAYLHYISNAKHYIYIENQYFISSLTPGMIQNKISQAIYQRLTRAIQAEETFRVIVLLPVYPAGDVATAATQYIIKYGYKTINRSNDTRTSLMERLRLDFPTVDLSQYISFVCLRKYEFVEVDGLRKPLTEQIYIHAKMMIVDDDHVIIGSANINDRSMEGSRDSEIAYVVSSSATSQADGLMNGVPTRVGLFARDLRIRLWSNYLGLSLEEGHQELLDPTHPSTYQRLLQTAAANSAIFNRVFLGLPDVATTLAKLTTAVNEAFINDLASIKGFLTLYPLNFLSEEVPPVSGWIMPKIAFL